MAQTKKIKPFYEVVTTLEAEWRKNQIKTQDKILGLIEYHGQRRNSLIVCLYRCALVQLKDGKSLDVLDYGKEELHSNADGKLEKITLLEKKLKEIAGI